MVESGLVLRSYFSLGITGLNVKQLLMAEAESSTSQASCKTGQAGGRKAGGSSSSGHTALPSRVDFQALRTDSAFAAVRPLAIDMLMLRLPAGQLGRKLSAVHRGPSGKPQLWAVSLQGR